MSCNSEVLQDNPMIMDVDKEGNNKGCVAEDRSSYRQILKATSLFGGVQVFNIFVTLLRGKLLAVLIGTAGMGLNGLLNSTLEVIKLASGMGLNESAIRDISKAKEANDKSELKKVYTIFRSWIWLSAILGVILTIALSPLLSRLTFDDYSYTKTFMFLSVTFLFTALTGGLYTLLRGMRKINLLASANISGSVAGLLVVIPIFYFYGIKGVVPAIVASSATTYVVSLYFRKKVNVKAINMNFRDVFAGGKQMVVLGVVLTLSTLLTTGSNFLLNAFISKVGSLEELGLFSAGSSIMTGYVGMVFVAMSTDYFPRLSGVINDSAKWKNVVNQQAEVVILILGPILSIILLSAPILVRLLLSEEFLPVIGYLKWASLAIMLKGITWVSGFVLISKRDNSLFFITELIGVLWFLFFNVLFFKLYGIEGLGIALNINYLFSVIMLYVILKRRYGFVISMSAYRLVGLYMFLLSIGVGCIVYLDFPNAYYGCGVVTIVVSIISLKELDKRIGVKNIISNFRSKLF